MAHPMKGEVKDAINNKMKRMTMHYGAANPSMNKSGDQTKFKEAGIPEDWVGFGSEPDKVSARSDRAARRSSAANPVATYKRGGAVKHHRDSGGSVSAIEQANENQSAANRARGGRLGKHKSKAGTHVNVMVMPHSGNQPPMGGGLPPQLAALAGGAHPPMAPPPGMPPGGAPAGAPPMAGPMGAPPMPPQGPMMRKKGGRANHPDAAQDKALIEKTLKDEGLIRRARGGGIHLTAGAGSGEGRLEKMRAYERMPGLKKKQDV